MTHLLDAIELLVDDQVGIIRQVRERRKDGGAPDLVYMSAGTCNLNVLSPDQFQKVFVGTGAAGDRPRAMVKAVGEAVERYCAANYTVADFHLATFDSVQFPCVQPEEFALFSAAQYTQSDFPYRPFERTTPVRWVSAIDLRTGDTRYVPAALVFLPYDQKHTGETPIAPQISTGLACHSSPTEATLSAIYEVIERDAIAITWQARLQRSQICSDTLGPRNRELLARLERPGASVTLLHLAMDHGIPVIFALLRSKVREAPALVVAAAAHLDAELAVQKSLEELAQIWSLAQWVKSERPKFFPGKKWEQVVDPDTHAAVYFDQANAHFAEFLWKSRDRIALSEIENFSAQDPSQDLLLLVEKIIAVKHSVLVVDVTTEDVRSLGLWVVRALVPGFHPLFMGHRFRALGGTRLWEVPQRLGYPGLVRKRGDNPAPHPFA